jgi:Zn-dependent protease
LRAAVSITPGGLAPAAILGGLFAVFAPATGLHVGTAVLLGAVGGTASLLVHELGHVRAARHVAGIHSAAVSLMWIGAATRFEGRYANGREQASVALGGPTASLTFALTLMACGFAPVPSAFRDMLLALALFNIVLGVVNLVPAYPLDGYKLVVGLLWSATGSERKARKILRRIAIGWAALELPATLFLLVEKPLLGGLVVVLAVGLFAQRRLFRAATAQASQRAFSE